MPVLGQVSHGTGTLLSIRLAKFHIPCAITANLKFRKNKFSSENKGQDFFGGDGGEIGFLGPGAPPPSCLMFRGADGLDEGLRDGLLVLVFLHIMFPPYLGI